MNELKLWQALACFGQEQVARVLEDPQWQKIFPDVLQRLASKDDRARYDTLIPAPMLKTMAARKPYQYAFGVRGNTLMCCPHPEDMPEGFLILLPLEVLDRYGSELLFEAVDRGAAVVDQGTSS